jgi:hypothetical protein
VHESKGSMLNPPSQGYGAAGLQRPALLTTRLGRTSR